MPAPGMSTRILKYVVPEYGGGAPSYTSLADLRGPRSAGGRSKRYERSSHKSLTRLEIRASLREAAGDPTKDITQEIKAKLEPLIPLGPTAPIVGASPHKIQASPLVAYREARMGKHAQCCGRCLGTSTLGVVGPYSGPRGLG